MSSIYGENIKISIFGQSHSNAIGVNIDGLPAGIKINFEQLHAFLKRRAPGQQEYTTKRKEEDLPEILSGVVNGVTCGAPLCAIIKNKDTFSQHYANIVDIPRPAHADYPAQIKFKGYQDVAGGGHFSGRLTAPLCIAGGIAIQILQQKGIEIAAHILSIGDIKDKQIDFVNISKQQIEDVKSKSFAVFDDNAGQEMISLIKKTRSDGDSVGGVIQCIALGLPAGIGDPMFNGMENRISSAIFAIPAIKAIEFGNGFEAAKLFGSQNNDSYYYDENEIKTTTNNHGGILGGITTGMPLIFRVAVKPTPSIAKPQQSISFSNKSNQQLTIKGRHDPCIVPRAVACVESATAIAILDALLKNNEI